MSILQKNSFETNGSFEKSPVILLKQSPDELQVIMPFKYTDEKENFLYAWRAFSYGKKIEIFC